MARAITSLRCTSRSPTRCSTSPRIGAGVRLQVAKPRWADATARATSSGPERGKQPITSSQSAGLRFSKYAPVVGATQSPAMKFLKFSGIGSGVGCQGLSVQGVSAAGECRGTATKTRLWRSEEHTSELQSLAYLVCRLLLEKKKKKKYGC